MRFIVGRDSMIDLYDRYPQPDPVEVEDEKAGDDGLAGYFDGEAVLDDPGRRCSHEDPPCCGCY